MSTIRSALAVSAPSLGRRARHFIFEDTFVACDERDDARGDDVRLFGYTFLGGFLFMAVYLA